MATTPLPPRGDGERLYPCRDWSRLTDLEVEVRHAGRPIRKGRIDAATPDGSIVWLAQDGALERTLVDKGLGFEIWIFESQLSRADSAIPSWRI